MNKLNRRNFAKICAVAGAGSIFADARSIPTVREKNPEKQRLRLALNAYSFDKPLRAGTMSIDNLLEFCSAAGLDAVDLTGYYFTGYPAVPSDDVIYKTKRNAYRLGVAICGTGVRNDFTWADAEKRKSEKQLVKDWVIVAEKLGAPQLRIFTGTLSKENFGWDERAKWIAEDIRECAEFGKDHGVMMAVQNHNDFLKTSADVEKMMSMTESEWTGLMLDIGSYHTPDPYKDIEANIKHAISWQFKEKVFVNDAQVDTNYDRLFDIILKSGYTGYLPLETLGEGDPVTKVRTLLEKIKNVMRMKNI